MMFNKDCYLKFGGHKRVKNKIVEDMEIVRELKNLGYRTATLAGNNFIKCRMYNGFKEAVKGFTKNFYPGFNIGSFGFIVLLLFFAVMFLLPFVMVLFQIKYLIIIVLMLLERIFTSVIAKQNVFLNILFLFPQLIMLQILGYKSLIANKFKKVTWKNRTIN